MKRKEEKKKKTKDEGKSLKNAIGKPWLDGRVCGRGREPKDDTLAHHAASQRDGQQISVATVTRNAITPRKTLVNTPTLQKLAPWVLISTVVYVRVTRLVSKMTKIRVPCEPTS